MPGWVSAVGVACRFLDPDMWAHRWRRLTAVTVLCCAVHQSCSECVSCFKYGCTVQCFDSNSSAEWNPCGHDKASYEPDARA